MVDTLSIEHAGRRALYRAELDATQVARWLDAAPGWFGESRTPLQAFPHKRNLARADDGTLTLVAKRACPAPWRARLVSLGVGHTRAERAFRMGLAFEQAGVTTPRVLAWLVFRSGASRCDYVLAEQVDAQPLWPGELDVAHWRRRLDALALTLARLHDARLRHRDLKAPNIYATCDGTERVGLFDLDSAAQLPRPSRGRAMRRDLGRLAASFQSEQAVQAGVVAGDWSHLVERYVEHRQVPIDASALLAHSLAWASKKRQQNARRGRPLA